MSETPAAFTDRDTFRAFALAGHAVFTVVGKSNRYTFKVTQAKPRDGGSPPPWFVSVLTGADNVRDYTWIGTLFQDGTFRNSPKAPIGPGAPSVTAATWFFRHLATDPALLSKVQVFHEGRCGKCGRALTTPESIQRGLGPVCAGFEG